MGRLDAVLLHQDRAVGFVPINLKVLLHSVCSLVLEVERSVKEGRYNVQRAAGPLSGSESLLFRILHGSFESASDWPIKQCAYPEFCEQLSMESSHALWREACAKCEGQNGRPAGRRVVPHKVTGELIEAVGRPYRLWRPGSR